MNFNNHSDLIGQHAFLGASKYHWVNYNEEKLVDSYRTFRAAQRGTELHDLACQCIRLGIQLPDTRETLNMYVNDAIGFKMIPEQPLFYSRNCFGTADSICFRKKILRIHDYKSGETPAHMEQLEIYAALFCLEYKHKPSDIDIILQIYQSNNIDPEEPNPDAIADLMDKIIMFDKAIEKMRLEV